MLFRNKRMEIWVSKTTRNHKILHFANNAEKSEDVFLSLTKCHCIKCNVYVYVSWNTRYFVQAVVFDYWFDCLKNHIKCSINKGMRLYGWRYFEFAGCFGLFINIIRGSGPNLDKKCIRLLEIENFFCCCKAFLKKLNRGC